MTAASNRIPLRVNHDEFAETFRSNGNPDSSFDMRNMNDETDRIKSRMKEFEDRCKKWREEFFNRQSNTGMLGDSGFEQRVPFSSPKFSSPGAGEDASFFSSSPNRPKPAFTSSLHKSTVEDTPEGGKKYKMEFEIGDFKPNELHLSTHGRTLIVKGDRELKAGSATETKTFNRELTVPDYVDIERMSAALLDNLPSGNSSNVLIIEAPIIMEKYSYRRSAFDNQSASPIRTSRNFSSNAGQPSHRSTSPPGGLSGVGVSIHAGASPSNNHHSSSSSKTTSFNPATGTTTTSESTHQEKRTSTTSTSQTTKIIRNSGSDGDFTEHVVISKPMTSSPSAGFDDVRFSRGMRGMPSNLSYNQSIAPELINGYPKYDRAEGCVVYKFDLTGFDQNEISLTITADRTLEIKASKELNDNLGKVYREFKREIQLEPEVDANLIKNLLFEGILTLKIPKPNRPDGLGSLSNNHNLHSPNGFREIYTDDGKLAKLTTDFRGYNPENLKIVLSANNVLKVSAQQTEASPNNRGTIQKECSRQYTLPAWIQPEQMKAIMSRDGVLTIDFTSPAGGSSKAVDERLHIN